MRLLLSSIVLFMSANFLMAQEDLKHWFHADPSEGFMGISSDKAYEELLKGKENHTVIVAIIDSGVDIEHEDLADNIWTNQGEIPGNGIDDDNNGYIDDIHGWNFIGGPNRKNVGPDTYEVTRLYGKYKYKYENANPVLLSKKERKKYDEFLVWQKEVLDQRAKATKAIEEVAGIETTVMAAVDALQAGITKNDQEFTLENINALESNEQLIVIGKNIAGDFMADGEVSSAEGLKEKLNEALSKDKKRQQDKLDFAYNPDFDPRSTIVMDDYSNPHQTSYGNNDVEGPDALHGTHVAGIVGAVRGNDINTARAIIVQGAIELNVHIDGTTPLNEAANNNYIDM